MNENKHTPEPWAYGEDNDGWYVEKDVIQIAHGLTEEDARRIVACVNACAGIDTELLEIIADNVKTLAGVIANVEKQRDELLAENERLNHNLTSTEQTMCEYQELAAKRLEEIDRLKEIEQTNDTLLEQLGDKNAALLDQVAGLTKKHNALKKTVFTNTNREVTIRNRFFTAHDDGVADQNFDFDAYLRIDGDFIDDEKKRYAQMIACTLNDYGRLATELTKYRDAPVVAWVEVVDSYEGPYHFNGEKLLNVGKHKLIVKPGEEK